MNPIIKYRTYPTYILIKYVYVEYQMFCGYSGLELFKTSVFIQDNILLITCIFHNNIVCIDVIEHEHPTQHIHEHPTQHIKEVTKKRETYSGFLSFQTEEHTKFSKETYTWSLKSYCQRLFKQFVWRPTFVLIDLLWFLLKTIQLGFALTVRVEQNYLVN